MQKCDSVKTKPSIKNTVIFYQKASEKVKAIKIVGGQLRVVKGVKADVKGMKKNYHQIKASVGDIGIRELIQKKSENSDSSESLSTNQALAYMEVTKEVAKIYAKVQFGETKVAVRFCGDLLDYTKRIRKLQKQKKRIQKNTTSEDSIIQDNTDTAIANVNQKKYTYDVSKLEESYKVHNNSISNTDIQETNKEEMLGVHPCKKEKEKIDHTPKELKQPPKEEKVKSAEKNLGIHSKDTKDTIEHKEIKTNKRKKQQKKKDKNIVRNSIAKREAKRYIVEQILLNGGDENCSSGIEAVVGNIIIGKGYEMLQKVFSSFGNAFKKAASSIVKWIIAIIFYLMKTIIKYLLIVLGMLVSFLASILTIVGVIAFAGIFLIAGFFVSATESGQFAVEYIDSYCNEIITLSKNYDEVVYHPSKDRYANYDDMMLVYLSKTADLEEDANLEGNAPFLWIDKNAEEKNMKSITESMFYYETSEYERTIQIPVQVTCTPTPEPTITQVPIEVEEEVFETISITCTPIPEVTATPIPIEVESELSESVVSPTPKVETEPQYTTIYIESIVMAKKIDIYMMSASEYMSKVSNQEVLENYEILKELFESLGYVSYGGTTVCDYYGIEYKSFD